ncbi:MAG: hypothetical protein ACYC1W_12850, partial [Gemmatimonadaceae bacterium]
MPHGRSMIASGILLLSLLLATSLPAQGVGDPARDTVQNSALRAYLDCRERGCDRDFFVTEMKWVNWM